MIDSPSGKVPEKASKWDSGRTEVCGGVKSVSGGSMGFSIYLRIYRSGIRLDGAAWGPRGNRARPTPSSCPVPCRLLVCLLESCHNFCVYDMWGSLLIKKILVLGVANKKDLYLGNRGSRKFK